ncbi:DUF3515 family protein [Nesterenkonia flava]|uniref:DUF3515 family protein n=1 Tax=Nesterenkonia flava TaxID=469799 RepID=A0ABU1FRS0_9MICC|nr:DUF3515 family protein [Nesterenkonia flava]MDR5711351.1 DUF3515 family protein [Nesterenkonia flava]
MSANPVQLRRKDGPLPKKIGRRRRAVTAWTLSLAATAALTGCSPTVGMDAAPYAADPECAQVMLLMPEEVAELDRRPTDAQATAAWGNPAQVLVRCGVEPPGPTPEHCVTAEGIDWLAIEHEDYWQLVSYGREPAVEVLLDADEVPSSSVMLAMGPTVAHLEQTRECTTVGQEIETGDGA